MTRALLLGATTLAVLVAAAALLSPDRIAVSGENKLDQRLAPGMVSVVDVARALDYADQQGQRSVYATLGERLPGVVLVVDPERPGIATTEARALGRVASVIEAPGFEVDRPDRPPDVVGVYRLGDWRPWELHLVDDEAAVLVVRDRRGVTLLVDARLIRDEERRELGRIAPDLLLDVEREDVATRPRPIAAGLLEAALLVTLMLVGGLLVPTSTYGGRTRPAMALLVGVALQAAVGAFVPGIALLVVPTLVGAVAAVRLTVRWGPVGWGRTDVTNLVATAVGVSVISVLVRTGGWVVVSTDGGSYLVRAALQAAGDAAPLGSKGSAFSALHASGILVGADGLFGLGPVLLLATTVVLGRPVLEALRTAASVRIHRMLLAAVLGLVLVLPLASAGIRFSSMLVHAHLLVAAQTVAMLLLWSGRDVSGRRSPPGSEAVAAATLAASIVLARPEGFLVPLLVLLGTLRSGRSRPQWAPVFVVTGLAVTAQFGFDTANVGLLVEAFGDEDRGRGVLGAAGSGVIGPLIVLAPLLLRPVPPRVRALLPPVVAAVTWVGFLLAVRSGALRLDRSLSIARENVFTGAGGWGVTLPVLVVLTLFGLGLLVPRIGQSRHGPLVMLVVLFVPLAQLSKNLGDGIGRVHWHDSVNRIWMHGVLAAILLVVVGIAELASEDPTRRTRAARVVAPVLLIGMLAVGRAWDPMIRTTQEWVASPVPGPAVAAAPELTTGRQVLHALEVVLPDPVALRRAIDVEVCADVRFGTYGRINDGRVEIRLAVQGGIESEVLEGRSLADNAVERVCWPLGDGPAALDGLHEGVLIGVRGLDPSPAPTVLLTAAGDPDIALLVRWEDPNRWGTTLVRGAPVLLAMLLGTILVAWSWIGLRTSALPAGGPVRLRWGARHGIGRPEVRLG